MKSSPAMAYLNWDEELLPSNALQWAATNAQAAELVTRAICHSTGPSSALGLAKRLFHLEDLSPSFCRTAADWILQLKCMQREREAFVECALLGVESVHSLASSSSLSSQQPLLLLTTDVHDAAVQSARHVYLVIRGAESSERIERCAMRRVLVAESKVLKRDILVALF